MPTELELREPSLLMQAVCCSLMMLEGADTQLLGASTKAIIPDLQVNYDNIAEMNIYQGVATNAFAVAWGIAADRGIVDRRYLLITAAMGQGLITILLALTTGYGNWMIFLRIMNGVFLSGLRPITNGVIADATSEELQGKVFGRAQSCFLLGMSFCSFAVSPLAPMWLNLPIFGVVRGWRVGWILVGLLSVAASAFTMFCMDPDNKEKNNSGTMLSTVFYEIGLVAGFFGIPSFPLMIAQGVFGTIPWTVMWYQTRFFQFTGMKDDVAGFLVGLNPVSGALGTMLGGEIADRLAAKFGHHGRPLNAQITVALGIPVMYMVLVGIAPGSLRDTPLQGFWIYFGLLSLFGIVSSWAQGGTNFPILSQIVPSDNRSRVLAMEGALENSLATVAGNLAVPFIARSFFGFNLNEIPDSSGLSDEERLEIGELAALAIGSSLQMTATLPWLSAYIIYSLLHWSFPRDYARLVASQSQVVKRSSSTFAVWQYTAAVGPQQ